MRVRIVETGEDPAAVTFDDETIAIIEPIRGWRIFYSDDGDIDETGDLTKEQAIEKS